MFLAGIQPITASLLDTGIRRYDEMSVKKFLVRCLAPGTSHPRVNPFIARPLVTNSPQYNTIHRVSNCYYKLITFGPIFAYMLLRPKGKTRTQDTVIVGFQAEEGAFRNERDDDHVQQVTHKTIQEGEASWHWQIRYTDSTFQP